jgi:Glu-tRNA(Gln) amidotransferase subunit E-like FAD-binding protein
MAKKEPERSPVNPPRMGRPPDPVKRFQTTIRLRPDLRESLQVGAQIAGKGVTMTDILEELIEEWAKRNEGALRRAREALQAQKLR